jgi:hypothetical protein
MKFITGHHFSLASSGHHSYLGLQMPNDTRFCTEIVSQSRLIEIKESLQETVEHRNCVAWLQKLHKTLKDHGLELRARGMDEAWWTRINT